MKYAIIAAALLLGACNATTAERSAALRSSMGAMGQYMMTYSQPRPMPAPRAPMRCQVNRFGQMWCL